MSMILTVLIAASAAAAGDDEVAALLKKAAYPLTEAIRKATPIAKEGVLVSAELEAQDGRAVYVVEFALDKKVIEIKLDAATGELLKKDLEDDDKSDVVKACKLPLAKGSEIATAKVPGKLVAAEAEIEDDKPILETKIFADGKLLKVKVHAVTGEVLKIKGRKSESETKEGDKK
jgi:uncharacterized membrane protein YkoI